MAGGFDLAGEFDGSAENAYRPSMSRRAPASPDMLILGPHRFAVRTATFRSVGSAVAPDGRDFDIRTGPPLDQPDTGEVYVTSYVRSHEDVSELVLHFAERAGARYRVRHR